MTMRSKDSISIPTTSPILSRSGAYSKAHANFQQPKLLTKTVTTTRYGGVQGRSGSNYGAAVTPSNRATPVDHSIDQQSYRMVSMSMVAGTKTGP